MAKIMKNKGIVIVGLASVALFLFLGAGMALASEATGTIETGLSTGPEGTVAVAPTASPAAGGYNANQSVTLTSSGSTAICYTVDGTTPACADFISCSVGTWYSSAISITSTRTLQSIACFSDNSTSSVSSDTYTLTCTISSVSNGSVSSYPGCTITCNSSYTLSGNTCVSSGGGGGGGGAVGDTTAPSISDIAFTVNSTEATITYKTNESSISWIVYGTSTAYGSEKKTIFYKISHSLTLENLSPLTTYHYQVKSKDSSGNIGSYTDKTLTTLAERKLTTGQVSVAPTSTGETTATTEEGSSATINVPAGAVSADTVFTVTPVGKAEAIVGDPPAGSFLVGDYVYNFTATADGQEVTSFGEAVTLTFTYTDDQIEGLDESTLQIYWWDEANSEWVALVSTVDRANNIITIIVTHFTYFAIMGEEEVVEEEVPTKPYSEMTIAELQAEITKILALIAQVQAQLALLLGEVVIEGVPAGFTFENNLQLGDVSTDVKYLQIVLNSSANTRLADSGVGSPGNETTYFGPLTKTAVIKFQEKYPADTLTPWGLTSGTGFVGSTTREKLSELLAE